MMCTFLWLCVWICAFHHPAGEASDWKWEPDNPPTQVYSSAHRAGKVKFESNNRTFESNLGTRAFRFPENKLGASGRIKQAAFNEGARTEYSTMDAPLEERNRANGSSGVPQVKVVSSFSFHPAFDPSASPIPYADDVGELLNESPESNSPFSFSENHGEQNIDAEVDRIHHLVQKSIGKKTDHDYNGADVRSKAVYDSSSLGQLPSDKESQILDVLRRRKHAKLNEVERADEVLKSKIESLIWLVLNSDLNTSEAAVGHEQYEALPPTTDVPGRSGDFVNFPHSLREILSFPFAKHEAFKHSGYAPWREKTESEKNKQEFHSVVENHPEAEVDEFKPFVRTPILDPNSTADAYNRVQRKAAKDSAPPDDNSLHPSFLKHIRYEASFPNLTRENLLKGSIHDKGSSYTFPFPVYSALEILENFARTKNLDSFPIPPFQFFNNVAIFVLDSDRQEAKNIPDRFYPYLEQVRRIPKHNLDKDSEMSIPGNREELKFLFYRNSIVNTPDAFITMKESDFPTDVARRKHNASTSIFQSTSAPTTDFPFSSNSNSKSNSLIQNSKKDRGSSNGNGRKIAEAKGDFFPIPPTGHRERPVLSQYAIVRPPSIPVPTHVIHEVYPSSKEASSSRKKPTTECYSDDCFVSGQFSKFDGAEESLTDPAEIILSCSMKDFVSCTEGKLRWTWLPAFVNNGVHLIGEGKDVYSLDSRFQLRPCNKIGTESKLVIKNVNKAPSLRGEYMCQFRRCGEKEFSQTQRFIV